MMFQKIINLLKRHRQDKKPRVVRLRGVMGESRKRPDLVIDDSDCTHIYPERYAIKPQFGDTGEYIPGKVISKGRAIFKSGMLGEVNEDTGPEEVN
jgi:hypothetical protein